MKRRLKELTFGQKNVLMRVDFNVPMKKSGEVIDDSRIRLCLPSIKYVLDQGGRLILISHLGRPKGKEKKELSLKPIADHLSTLLNQEVQLVLGDLETQVKKRVENLKDGQACLLENIRFHAGEERPDQDPTLVKKLAALGSVYVNEAFATAHREHTSTTLLAREFPSQSGMGFLMEKESASFSHLLQDNKRPFYAIMGGAKISTKIDPIKALLSKIDALFIGGGMAFAFAKCRGIEIGDSLCQPSHLPSAEAILEICSLKDIPVHLPNDWVIAQGEKPLDIQKVVEADQGIPKNWQGMDIGPSTVKRWEPHLKKGALIFWNGPMGVYELDPFRAGTNSLAKLLGKTDSLSIVGGGDSVAAIKANQIQEKFSHLSSGGGASLEYLAFGHLPGIDALSDTKDI